MKNIANLLFEARMLKEIPRSGYAFLGAGDESVAEHTFMITFIAFVMAQTMPEVDGIRLVNMCLVHDLPEARIGDLNPVQKQYVKADESLALSDTTRNLPFGKYLTELMEDFNTGKSMEARLARDADQLALFVDLKALKDMGYTSPEKWLPHVRQRLVTETGRLLAEQIMGTNRDDWWLPGLADSSD